MELEIGGKNYVLKFGLAFLDELDRQYPMSLNGSVTIPFYDGLNYAYMGLQQANPQAFFKLIKSATITEKSKPSNYAIEEFISELTEEDILGLADDFFTSLRATNILKFKMKALDQRLGQI